MPQERCLPGYFLPFFLLFLLSFFLSFFFAMVPSSPFLFRGQAAMPRSLVNGRLTGKATDR